MVATPGKDTIGMLGWLTVVTGRVVGVNHILSETKSIGKKVYTSLSTLDPASLRVFAEWYRGGFSTKTHASLSRCRVVNMCCWRIDAHGHLGGPRGSPRFNTGGRSRSFSVSNNCVSKLLKGRLLNHGTQRVRLFGSNAISKRLRPCPHRYSI